MSISITKSRSRKENVVKWLGREKIGDIQQGGKRGRGAAKSIVVIAVRRKGVRLALM
jgi:hypothetical protein